MTIFEGIILGIIQGITEFFPVSSSGHLVIFKHFLNIEEAGILFEVLVHFATLIAVIIVFWQDILSILKKPFQKLTYLIIAGVIPTAIIGLAFHGTFAKMFGSIKFTAAMLLITGVILWVVDNYISGGKPMETFTIPKAIFVGLAQGLAIFPGLSRSGTTIAASLALGLDRQDAPRFSFLLSIPVILGATLVEAKDLLVSDFNRDLLFPYLAGAIAAGITGYFAITLFIRFIRMGKLHYFSYYCWAVGGIILVLQMI